MELKEGNNKRLCSYQNISVMEPGIQFSNKLSVQNYSQPSNQDKFAHTEQRTIEKAGKVTDLCPMTL